MARFLFVGLLGFCACANDASTRTLESHSEAVVYGEDDRVDVYAHPDARVRDIARRSIVALVGRERFSRGEGIARGVQNAHSLKAAYDVCSGERFAEQPVSADCSGVLIADDLVLTAGHCFDSDDCSRYAYVFDFFYDANGAPIAIDDSDVFGCREMVAREVSTTGAMTDDFAVVRLDRPVNAPRQKLAVRRGALESAEALTVIGFPSGLPAKIDSGASVRDARKVTNDYFALDSDTFEGSSGSAVIDEKGRLLGVLVRGGRDYVEEPDGGCARVRVLEDPESHAPWEQASYASRAIDVLCARRPDVMPLCAREPVCGDGLCEPVEAVRGCAVDCLDTCAMALCRSQVESDETPVLALDAGVEEDQDKRRVEIIPSKGPGCSATGTAPFDAFWCLSGLWMLARGRRPKRNTPR